jgi:hypothetical protein
MSWTAAGAVISHSSTFFNWGRNALEALQGYDYLATHDTKSANLLYWLFSPRGAQLFTVLFLVAFFVAVIRTVSSAQQPEVEGTAGDRVLQKDENRPLAPSEPNIMCVAAKTDWVGRNANYTFVERLRNEGGISYVATFANEPDDKHPEIGSIKKVVARIVFNRLDGSLVHRVHTGVWLEEDFNFTDFGKGSIRKLLIGKVEGEGFKTFNDNRESEDRYLPPSDEHIVGNTELKVHVHLFSLEDSKFSADATLDLLSGKSYGIAIADPDSPTTTKFSNMSTPKFRFKGRDTQPEDVINALVTFSERGDGLLKRAVDNPTEQVQRDISAWEIDVADYIANKRSKAEERLFISDASMERYFIAAATSSHRNILDRIHTRLVRLNKIIDELRPKQPLP